MPLPSLLHSHADRQRLLALARRWLGDTHAAEDLLHEAWLRCQQHGARDGEMLQAWLPTVLRRLCIDTLRRQARYRVIVAAVPDLLLNAGMAAGPDQLHEGDAALDELLAVLLRRLSSSDVLCLLLHVVFEMDHAQVGALCGRNVVAARKHMSRVLQRLRSDPARLFESAADEVEDAYLFALCRRAIAEGDPAALVAVLRASHPQVMASAAAHEHAARGWLAGQGAESVLCIQLPGVGLRLFALPSGAARQHRQAAATLAGTRC